MNKVETEITGALKALATFRGSGLASTVSRLEQSISHKTGKLIEDVLSEELINQELLAAAVHVKRASAQIDEIVHTVGILLCLGELLDDDEHIESVSLAAGNTGKSFDLTTDRRVAEFTFIDWKGGSESIRKQKLFKDFYLLAEAETDKQRYLYFLGDTHARKVFSSRSPGKGLLRKFAGLQEKFVDAYGGALTAREYYDSKKHLVQLVNLEIWAPLATASFRNALD